jgi:hypothetical protein
MGDKEEKTDSEDESYSDSLEIFDNIFSEGKAADVPDTKKGQPRPTAPPVKAAAPKHVQKTGQAPAPSKIPPAKKAAPPAKPIKTAPSLEATKEKQPGSDKKDGGYSESVKIPEDIFKKGIGADVPGTKKEPPRPTASPVKTAAAITVKKPEQRPAPQQVPPAKKAAEPTKPVKPAPQVEQAKPKEKEPGAKREDEAFSDSQELFDSIFGGVADTTDAKAKRGTPPSLAPPAKSAAPKQVRKGQDSKEQAKKVVEQRPVPPKVTPAREAVPSAQVVKSGRFFEADKYPGKGPSREEGFGRKEPEKMEVYEGPKKSPNPFIIASSIIVLVILAMLTGMYIEDRSGIIGGIRTTRNSTPEKEAPASTNKDTEASEVIDGKSEIREPEIQVSQQLKEENPPAIDKTPSAIPPQVTDKVIASEEQKPLSYPYSLYLGSYDKLETVKDVASDYEAMGLSPYWVKADLGEKGIWFRLFANYFQTRQEADNFIKTRQIPSAEAQKTRYVSLIGMYSSAQELTKQRKIIEELGYCPYVISDNKNIFWLYVGAFYQKNMAEDQNAELLQKGIQSKVVER